MTNFQEDLLTWYQKNKRPLLFRQDANAYKIWISEIMAQQTRIEAMLPYFERFIEKVPDIPTLATIADEQLNKLWQGLGYYSRARNLKKCAQVCMEKYDGQLPKTKAELEQLPGIGPYTAGAIASIAYHEPVSAIDGNVLRVFSRLYDIHADIKKSAGKKQVSAKVDESLPDGQHISDYNQALMELGALVCIPKKPRCEQCPVRRYCQTDDPSELPVMSKPKPRRVEHKHLYIWVYQNKLRIVKRKEKGLLYGLYGFDEEKPDIYYKEIVLKPYTHIFSHVEWHMEASLVFVDTEDENFHTLAEIDKLYAIPSAFTPFLKQVQSDFMF